MKFLGRLGIAAQARLITWLAIVCGVLAAAAGSYVFSLYEDFRREITEAEVPLLHKVSAANIELSSIQQDLMNLIDQARRRVLNEETIYRQGKVLLDRADTVLEALPSTALDPSHPDIRSGAFRAQVAHYRGALVSAVEMLSVSIGMAETLVQRAAIDALAVNRGAAMLQQQVNAEMADEAQHMRATLLYATVPIVATLLFTVGVTFLMLRAWAATVIRNVGSVQETLSRLRAGDTALPVSPVDSSRESGDLAASLEAFRGTLLELAALRADLESKVEDRTELLRAANDELSSQIKRLNLTQRELHLFKRVFDNAAEAIVITDLDATMLDVNAAYSTITGYSRDEVIGRNPRMLSSGRHDAEFYRVMWDHVRRTGRWSGEIWDRRRDGESYPLLLSITTVHDDQQQPINYVGVFTDITRLKTTEKQLEQLAFSDRLTGLPNRRLLFDRIEHAIGLAQRSQSYGGVLFLDLDRFKHVNDTLGHQAGDELLIEVAARLKASVREGDTVGRLAGDEFLVVIENLSSDVAQATSKAQTIGEKIVTALAMPYTLSGKPVHASACVGIALFGADDLGRVEALLTNADAAMYQAKRRGRGNVHFFDPKMQESIRARIDLERRLRVAVREGHFRLALQPQVDSQGRIVGAEALLRWHDPSGPPVAPAQFIPLAEEIHLIQDIGRWVMHEACRVLRSWQDDAVLGRFPLAINVSGRQFCEPHFVADATQALADHGVSPSRLKFELTESVVVADIDESIAKMRQLQQRGIRLAMDDFGTGYSSLSNLRRLPFDQIKIDRSFVASMLKDRSDQFIVHSVVQMGQLLGIEVIAEGVETAEQSEGLLAAGCSLYQGYLFGRPMPIEDFEAFVRAKHSRVASSSPRQKSWSDETVIR